MSAACYNSDSEKQYMCIREFHFLEKPSQDTGCHHAVLARKALDMIESLVRKDFSACCRFLLQIRPAALPQRRRLQSRSWKCRFSVKGFQRLMPPWQDAPVRQRPQAAMRAASRAGRCLRGDQGGSCGPEAIRREGRSCRILEATPGRPAPAASHISAAHAARALRVHGTATWTTALG